MAKSSAVLARRAPKTPAQPINYSAPIELDSDTLDGLRPAWDYCRRDLRPHRRERRDRIRATLGLHYGDNGSSDKMPSNALNLYRSIMIRSLSAKLPKAIVHTEYGSVKPDAYDLELGLNYLAKKMDLKTSIRECVVDAMDLMGIMCIGLDPRRSYTDAQNLAVGEPFADRVDFDDWNHDTLAKRITHARFYGHRTRNSLSAVLNEPMYSEDGKQHLQPFSVQTAREDGEERVEEFGRSNRGYPDDYTKTCELIHPYLPEKNLIVTLPGQIGANVPLRVQRWSGPRRGPYRFLSFGDVPNNIIPNSPTSQLQDISDSMNAVLRKAIRRAERAKRNLLAPLGQGEIDAESLREANDGEIVPVSLQGALGEFDSGGNFEGLIALYSALKDIFSYMAGNIEAIGGLGPQADTLGQDEMLAQAASKQVQDMQDRTHEFMQGVYEDLGFQLYNHPLIQLPIVKCVPGFPNLSLQETYTPAYQEAPFFFYNIKIDVYSGQYLSPAQQMQALRTLVGEMVLPLMPLMQQQGVMLDVAYLFELVAQFTGFDEVRNLVIATGKDPNEQHQPIGQPPSKFKPANTTRTNIRINRPGANSAGKTHALLQAAMGGGQQPSQAAQMFRRVG